MSGFQVPSVKPTCAQLLAQLLELRHVEVLDVNWEVNCVQQGGGWALLTPVAQLVLTDCVPIVGVLLPATRSAITIAVYAGGRTG